MQYEKFMILRHFKLFKKRIFLVANSKTILTKYTSSGKINGNISLVSVRYFWSKKFLKRNEPKKSEFQTPELWHFRTSNISNFASKLKARTKRTRTPKKCRTSNLNSSSFQHYYKLKKYKYGQIFFKK